MKKVAEDLGITYSRDLKGACGTYNGYMVSIRTNSAIRQFVLSMGVKEGTASPTESLGDFCNGFVDKKKGVVACGYKDNNLEMYITNTKYIVEAIDTAIAFLRDNMYESCCVSCKTNDNIDFYQLGENVQTFCPHCFSEIYSQLAGNKEIIRNKKGNMLTGIVGAFLGSLIGVALWMGINYLGYVAAIVGVVLGVCVINGYEKFGGKINALGIVLCLAIMIVMGFCAEYFALVIQVFTLLTEDGFSFSESFAFVNMIMIENSGMQAEFLLGLAQAYFYVALGAVPAIISAYKNSTGSFVAKKLELV